MKIWKNTNFDFASVLEQRLAEENAQKDPVGDTGHGHTWASLVAKLNEAEQVRHLEGDAQAMQAAVAGCNARLTAGEDPGTLDDLVML